MVDRPGGVPGGLISDVTNLSSGRRYLVSTAPELEQDYWTTTVIPIVEKRRLLGLATRAVPDMAHAIASFIRNEKGDAYQVHAEVRHVVVSVGEDDWFSRFPSPEPPEGYSVGAAAKLKSVLGDEARVPVRESPADQRARRMELIAAYGSVLEHWQHQVGRESDLPCARGVIEAAILEELGNPAFPEMVDALETGYLHLETFVPDDEYEVIVESERVFAEAGRLIDTGDPQSIRRSALLLGAAPKAATELREKILKGMHVRMEQFQRLRRLRNA